MRPLRRPSAPDLVVGPGERVLAWCRTVDDGVLAGTRDALYLDVDGDVTRIPWEQVEAADWDADTDMLRVSLVGTWGEQRIEHDL